MDQSKKQKRCRRCRWPIAPGTVPVKGGYCSTACRDAAHKELTARKSEARP